MKKVKRIIAVVLLILILALVGYSCHTCSRTADIFDKEQPEQQTEIGGEEVEKDNGT